MNRLGNQLRPNRWPKREKKGSFVSIARRILCRRRAAKQKFWSRPFRFLVIVLVAFL